MSERDVLTVAEREVYDNPMCAPVRPVIDRLLGLLRPADPEAGKPGNARLAAARQRARDRHRLDWGPAQNGANAERANIAEADASVAIEAYDAQSRELAAARAIVARVEDDRVMWEVAKALDRYPAKFVLDAYRARVRGRVSEGEEEIDG